MKLTKQQKLTMNTFILQMGLQYDENKHHYLTKKGEPINNPNKYLEVAAKSILKRGLTSSETAYVEKWLFMPFDFENVPYKTYLKEIVQEQNPSKVKFLKDNYSNYLESIKDSKKSKQCFYISGDSGTGKTTYAKILASQYYSEDEIYITAGGEHPFDEYYGEKCIIFDEFRANILPYSELLKLLDNNTTSDVGARYHNKNLARCELIIITSVIKPSDIYEGITEERYQLYRRINSFEIIKQNKNVFLYLLKYDKESQKYFYAAKKDVTKDYDKFYLENPDDKVIDVDGMFDNVIDKPVEEDEGSKSLDDIFD